MLSHAHQASDMSFIHCSPLFVPLMPLPKMKPEVVRSQRGQGTGPITIPTSSTMAASSKKKVSSSASTKGKSKQTAVSSVSSSHPLSQPPLFAVHSHTSSSQFPITASRSTFSTDPGTFTAQVPFSEHPNNVDPVLAYPSNT